MTNMIPNRTTHDEEIARLVAKVAETSLDDFRVKVYRRATLGASMESIAVLDGARVEHLSTPDPWLVPLFGGGPFFVLTVYHASDLNTPIATVCPPAIAGAKPLDEVQAHVMEAQGWQGPTRLHFAPRVAKPPAKRAAGITDLFSFGGGPLSGEPAPRNAGSVDTGATSDSSFIARRLAEVSTAEAQLREQRLLAQIEETRRESERQAKRSEEKLAEIRAAIATRPAESAKPGIDVVALIGALAPILTSFAQQRAEDQRRRDELDARREEREQRAREESAKRESAMMERIASQSSETAKVFAAQTEMIGAMSRTVVQTIATMQELSAPAPQENDVAGLLKAGLGAFAEWAATARITKMEQAQQAQRRLTAGRPPATPAPGAPTPAAGFGDAQQSATGPQPTGAVEVKDADPQDVLAEVEKMLREHEEAEEVAGFYLEAMTTNPGVPPLVQGAGGTVGFFQQRLGAEWLNAPGNLDYVQTVLVALQRIAKEHGIPTA
jgi:hypothetical protein